mgnify:FL=1
MGIDEDTALLVRGRTGEVLGSGAVYVVDGECVTHSNVAEARSECALSIHDVRMHVLSSGDAFDFASRQPRAPERTGSPR